LVFRTKTIRDQRKVGGVWHGNPARPHFLVVRKEEST